MYLDDSDARESPDGMRAVLEAVQGGDVDTLRRMLQDASGCSSGAHTASDAGGAASTSARTVPAAAERLSALFVQRSTVKLMLPNCDPVRLSTSPQSPPVFPARLPRQASPPVFQCRDSVHTSLSM